MFAPKSPPKSAADLRQYATHGSGTVRGEQDAQIGREIDFYARFAEEGITDARARQSAAKFRAAFDALNGTLASSPYLKGTGLTVLDIAWVVYVNRLSLCGYPFARLHPNVAAWSEPLIRRSEFAREFAMPATAMEALAAQQRAWVDAGKSFEAVCGL
jgi:glutathione S-transferase